MIRMICVQLAERRWRAFLADYEGGKCEGRYIIGELPGLFFDVDSFGLAVCSHLLFLYSDLLSQEFHVRAVLELCRVAREVRIFPLLTLGRKPSPHLAAVRKAVESQGWASSIERVDYELQRGGNEMLRISRKKTARALRKNALAHVLCDRQDGVGAGYPFSKLLLLRI